MRRPSAFMRVRPARDFGYHQPAEDPVTASRDDSSGPRALASDLDRLRRLTSDEADLAAVDRLVHHATIFEMNVESYRRRAAIARKRTSEGGE